MTDHRRRACLSLCYDMRLFDVVSLYQLIHCWPFFLHVASLLFTVQLVSVSPWSTSSYTLTKVILSCYHWWLASSPSITSLQTTGLLTYRFSLRRCSPQSVTHVIHSGANGQLRSARRHLVVVPRYNRSTYGRRAFSVATSWSDDLELSHRQSAWSIVVHWQFSSPAQNISVW